MGGGGGGEAPLGPHLGLSLYTAHKIVQKCYKHSKTFFRNCHEELDYSSSNITFIGIESLLTSFLLYNYTNHNYKKAMSIFLS